MDNFVNLHVHSLYSKQDAVIKIDELVDKVIEYGQNAVAVTDHSSTAAHFYLDKACRERNVKPIFGNEFYTNLSYENKTRNRNHLLCLGMTDEGIRNINRLQDIAVHNRYHKPIVSHEILPEYTEGIFATSACSLGIVGQSILNGKFDDAIDYCNWFNEIFNGNFALELQLHPDFDPQYVINNRLIDISEKTDIPLTISCDSHFLTENDTDLRRAIQCIAWYRLYKDGNSSLKSNCLGNSDIIKKNLELCNSNKKYTPIDMSIIEDAIKQTSTIAQKCNGGLCSSDRKVPIFDKYQEFDKLFEEIL